MWRTLLGLHVLVALLHLLDEPRQRSGLPSSGCVTIGVMQVRDALVRREFDHLRVDQDHPDLSGVARDSSETSIELTKLDLPEPVEPATSRCGILARFAEMKSPSNVLAQSMHQRVVVAAGASVR
jgi:hypothetical protein